ncbi:hypothetical protein B0H11DRAFT_2256658 [Mycena galericulata]|nr:hypothetical protein B0H11DRAFT_2256658 [Mycena galericulata]
MSLAVEGLPVTSVDFSGSLRTSVSASFYKTLRCETRKVLVTTVVPSYGSFSVFLDCLVVRDLNVDVLLGVDWAQYIQQTLGQEGYRIDSTFNAWDFFRLPNHPFTRHAQDLPLVPLTSRRTFLFSRLEIC